MMQCRNNTIRSTTCIATSALYRKHFLLVSMKNSSCFLLHFNNLYSTSAVSRGGNVNIMFHNSGPNYRSATTEPLNELSLNCSSRVKISWWENKFVFRQDLYVKHSTNESKSWTFLSFGKVYIRHILLFPSTDNSVLKLAIKDMQILFSGMCQTCWI